MISEIKVYAPGTVANVGCGFDVLGFALRHPGDYITIRKTDTEGIRIKKIRGDEGKLPLDPDKNTAGVAANEFMKKFAIKTGIELEITKGMSLGSGLGSSAASAAAALFGLNHLFNTKADKTQLLLCGLKAEKVACGSAHADNIAPSLLGGFVLIRSYNPLDVVSLNFPEDLFSTVVCPLIKLPTKKMRKVLPKKISLQTAVRQWGNVAGLVAGLTKKDYDLISRSLKDFIVEPKRSKFIPFFQQVQSRALASGALGCSISGSGPSIFALSQGRHSADKVAASMAEVYNNKNISHKIYVSSVNKEGPKLC